VRSHPFSQNFCIFGFTRRILGFQRFSREILANFRNKFSNSNFAKFTKKDLFLFF
jgi:hypothetical protein